MTGLEIERRFLVDEMPDVDAMPSVEIEQGYLVLSKKGQLKTRLRREDDSLSLTIRHPGGDDLGYPGGETQLTSEQFDAM